MDEPAFLTPSQLADDVAACLPEMRQIAAAQWSLAQLRSYSGTYFLNGLADVVDAFERGVSGAYGHLCEAIALRIAILHREGVRWVDFCGRCFYSNDRPLAQELTSLLNTPCAPKSAS